jgi:hypothetical protein
MKGVNIIWIICGMFICLYTYFFIISAVDFLLWILVCVLFPLTVFVLLYIIKRFNKRVLFIICFIVFISAVMTVQFIGKLNVQN